MEWVLIGVLGFCLVGLGGEFIHCKVLDWRERRAVQNAWEGCWSVARMSAPSWVSDAAARREAEKLFQISNERRQLNGQRPLPRHLAGVGRP
jgi:hypothetical protein